MYICIYIYIILCILHTHTHTHTHMCVCVCVCVCVCIEREVTLVDVHGIRLVQVRRPLIHLGAVPRNAFLGPARVVAYSCNAPGGVAWRRQEVLEVHPIV